MVQDDDLDLYQDHHDLDLSQGFYRSAITTINITFYS